VSNAPAFQSVQNWLLNLDMNVYFKGLVSTGIISGITGSSSGGAQIALANLGEYFIASDLHPGRDRMLNNTKKGSQISPGKSRKNSLSG